MLIIYAYSFTVMHFMPLFLESKKHSYFPCILALRNSLWHVFCGQLQMFMSCVMKDYMLNYYVALDEYQCIQVKSCSLSIGVESQISLNAH